MYLRIFTAGSFLLASLICSSQVLTTRPPDRVTGEPTASTVANASIPLTVPAGTPLKIALSQEVHLHEVGQPILGKTTEPVFAFDKLVIPAGTAVTGKVTAIEEVPKKTRTLAALNANFSPPHRVRVDFVELRLADGRTIPVKTVVSAGSAAVLELVAAQKPPATRTGAAKNAASREFNQAKQEIKREWKTLNAQLEEPGKMHRLERYAVAQLPWHPQYLESGANFNAELLEPLAFGVETMPAEALTSIGMAPPDGSLVHARLVTPLNSATAKQGDAVEAVITQPLVDGGHLILPEGSRLHGSVLQARAARHWSRSGQLRIVFHQVAPPSGVERQIQASLEAVGVAKDEHLALDSEGGAQVTNPKSRYLSTGISAVLAASSLHTEHENGSVEISGDNASNGALNGASGFKLVGSVVGAVAHSHVVSASLGFYGAGASAYSHFLARGREVVYPKDMMMIIGLGTRSDSSKQ